jgi:hypothetical protein
MFLKNLFNNKLSIVVVTTIILVSCQGGNKPASDQQSVKDSLSKTEISKDVKEIVYPLPTPFEITKMLNDIGAKYVASSLNPAEKADKYFTEKSKAVNLSVNGADLAYAATYSQKQDVELYSKASKTLIDGLGINIDYSAMLSDNFKQKVNNKDTLTKIVTNTFFDTYKYLNEKSNPDLAIMMASGMWIELMYIATHISEDTYHNTDLVRIIVKQKDSYGKLMKLLNDREANKDIMELETKLLVIKPVFDKVESGLKENDYLLILKTIQSVRKSIVS